MDDYTFIDGVKIWKIEKSGVVYPLSNIEKIDNKPIQEFFQDIDNFGGIRDFIKVYKGECIIELKK